MSERRGLYHGLNRGPAALAAHNRSVTADPPPAARVAADAARPPPSPAFSADARRPGAVMRGPVQDESGALDPLDAQAMREIEGHCDEEDGL
jgi:hypothetical protein